MVYVEDGGGVSDDVSGHHGFRCAPRANLKVQFGDTIKVQFGDTLVPKSN